MLLVVLYDMLRTPVGDLRALQGATEQERQDHFDYFYEELWEEMNKCGKALEMNVSL